MTNSEQIDILSLFRSVTKKGAIFLIIPVLASLGSFIYLLNTDNTTYRVKALIHFEPGKEYVESFDVPVITEELFMQKLLTERFIKKSLGTHSPRIFGKKNIDEVLRLLKKDLELKNQSVYNSKEGEIRYNSFILSIEGLPGKKIRPFFQKLLQKVTDHFEKSIVTKVERRIRIIREERSKLRKNSVKLLSGEDINPQILFKRTEKAEDDENKLETQNFRNELLSGQVQLEMVANIHEQQMDLNHELARLEHLRNNVPRYQIDLYVREQPVNTLKLTGMIFVAVFLIMIFSIGVYELLFNLEEHEVVVEHTR